MIKLEHVSKTFGSDASAVDAVQDVSLEIADGEAFGIIGFSGAGKSTLVRLINLLEKPSSGKVIVDGQDMTALKGRQLRRARRKIGMIFQQFNLFATRTVFDNVAFPLRWSGMKREEIEQKVRRYLKLVELEDKEKAYPSELSGGQKQRVALARALVSEPDILLCDEATSALDPQTTQQILRLLKRLNAELGITLVVITHEMQVVKEICTRVAVMESGRVVEMGDVFSIFAEPKQRITRSFIDTATNLNKINTLIDEGAAITHIQPGECIVKLTYQRNSTAQAIVSTVSRDFNVDVNIIFGNIELIEGDLLGGLVAILSGDKADIDKAIRYFHDNQVGVEVVLDARTA